MANIFEINNTTLIRHTCSNGLTFKADRADLVGGVTVIRDDVWFDDVVKLGKDFAEFGAWHALIIHPNLTGFGGYDNVRYNMVDIDG